MRARSIESMHWSVSTVHVDVDAPSTRNRALPIVMERRTRPCWTTSAGACSPSGVAIV
jgi:hypothetical protein